jgi:PAS domain S-box-containing protein
MSIETQKNFLGKTQTLLIAEHESERLSSWLRLIVAIGFSILAFINYTLEEISVNSFAVQMAAVLVMLGYSGYFLSRYGITNSRWKYASYLLSFLDVLVITTILYGYSLAPTTINFRSSLFCIYFIAIIFTALHNKISLSVFTGLFCIICYVLFSLNYLFTFDFYQGWIYELIINVFLILTISAVAGIISKKNYDTINKVISSEQRYQSLVHRLPEMLFTIDENGKFLWVNNASYMLLALPSKVVPGRKIQDFLVKPEQFKMSKGEFKATLEIKDFNGKNKFVDCTLMPCIEKNRPFFYEGIMTDVSDREIALSQREEMVNRLYQYQKMESLGTLAGGMAHDFNNILQTISDISMILKTETTDPKINNHIETILQTVSEAKSLVSELLALGRKELLDYKPINLQDFFDNILPLYGKQVGQQYKFVIKAPKEPLIIQGDEEYFKRIFHNLIINSRDAMPAGGTITIELFPDRSQGKPGTVIIKFIDTGTGIPHEIIDKIFDPFFTTKKKGKGTGLGLALVQKIVSLHNGHIMVEKTDSTGTVFRIEIPESETGEIEHDTTVIMLNRKQTMVLLLDDDPKIRGVLKFFMKEFNYLVCEASTINEGVKELIKHKNECEVAILDWKLGSEDPKMAINKLREINPSLIIIVVSGYPIDKNSAEEMKIWKWFTKPYDKNLLDREIQKALFYQKKQNKK